MEASTGLAAAALSHSQVYPFVGSKGARWRQLPTWAAHCNIVAGGGRGLPISACSNNGPAVASTSPAYRLATFVGPRVRTALVGCSLGLFARSCTAMRANLQEDAADRKDELMALTNDELAELCHQNGIASTGKKSTLVQRLLEFESDDIDHEREQLLDTLPMRRLKELCRTYGLSVRGLKSELIRRISKHEQEKHKQEAMTEQEDYKAMSAFEKLMARLEMGEINDEELEEVFKQGKPEAGAIVEGTVSKITDYGAWVSIEDSYWPGYIHRSEITDEFVVFVHEYLQVGDVVEAIVVDPQNNKDSDRVPLSIKKLVEQRIFEERWRSRQETRKKGKGKDPPELPAPQPLFRPLQKNPVEETLRELERRVSMYEKILINAGHGKALQAAYAEARDGMQADQVLPLEMMMPGQGSEQLHYEGPPTPRRRDAFDAILEKEFGPLQDKESTAASSGEKGSAQGDWSESTSKDTDMDIDDIFDWKSSDEDEDTGLDEATISELLGLAAKPPNPKVKDQVKKRGGRQGSGWKQGDTDDRSLPEPWPDNAKLF